MTVTGSKVATDAPPEAGRPEEGPSTVDHAAARARLRTMLAGLIGIVAALDLAHIASFPLSNSDTFFHLRFGHEFLHGSWSLHDPGSVSTYATAHWVPTQWLPQVVMAQFEDWFGLAGVNWLSGLQFLTLALVLYWICRREAEPLISVLLMVAALIACTPGMSMRPQQISYILIAVTVAAWLRAQKTGRVPWLLVPITYVWTMCHGMWPMGIVIGFVAVVGLLLDRKLPVGTLVRMFAVPVLSGLVSLLTPVGPGLFPAVLQVNSRAKYFYEWAPPDFRQGYCLGLVVLLALAVVPLLRRGRADWVSILLIGLAAAWSVYSLRTVPVAACMIAPLAARAAQPALGERPRTPRRERLVLAGVYAAALAGLALVVPHTAHDPSPYSDGMDAKLAALPAGTTVLDDSSSGGYLMWRFPQLDLVSHGYGDTFTDAELKRNDMMESVRPGWEAAVRSTQVQYALLDPKDPLGYALRDVEHWTVVETDKDMLLMTPPPGWMQDGS